MDTIEMARKEKNRSATDFSPIRAEIRFLLRLLKVISKIIKHLKASSISLRSVSNASILQLSVIKE